MRGTKTTRHSSRKHHIAAAGLMLAMLFGSLQMQAQPNLNFKRIVVNWPTIELYFAVGCNGQQAYDLKKADLHLRENGIPIEDFTLFCPDVNVRCAISVSLVFDASGSMSGTGNAGAKQAGATFIDLMDGTLDEATVIFFNTQVIIAQQMTTIKPLLNSAVDGLPAGGGTAVWDGCYAGIIELINNGVNQCRAVIVLTDGGDNSSTRTPAEIISLANRNRIRVYTVGLGSSINATELELIALLTGGRYYQTPNAGQIAAIYSEIAHIIFRHFEECVLTYRAACADGGMRTVELETRDYCGGTDVKTRTYRAPLDSATFSSLHLTLGDGSTMSGKQVVVPLDLGDLLPVSNFYPFSFTLEYDTSALRFIAAEVPPGGLLAPTDVDVQGMIPGAIAVATTSTKMIAGKGRLMELTFEARPRTDTLCTTVRAQNGRFAQGCHLPVITSSEVCVYPSADVPLVTCAGVDAPAKLVWNDTLRRYDPFPVAVTARFSNGGERAATVPFFQALYDTSKLTGIPDSVPKVFSFIPVDSTVVVTRYFTARPQDTDREVEVCITGMFNNHPHVTCCTRIMLPRVGAELDCALDVPTIVADESQGKYLPMPFPLTVTAFNRGGSATAAVIATVHLPSGLSLAPPDAPSGFSKSFPPAQIQPGHSAAVTWMLLHPPTETERRYRIPVTVKTANADSTQCEIELVIPVLKNPRFPVELQSSGAREFCEGGEVTLDAGPGYASYEWNTGDTTAAIVVRRSGSYFCTVRDASGAIGMSDTLSVTVHLLPHPHVTLQGSNPKCPEDTIALDAGAGFVSYAWNAGGTTRYLQTTDAGMYFCAVTDSNGCPGVSDTLVVTLLASPVPPIILRSVDTLKTVNAATWQWYRNGQLLPGATRQYHMLQQPGMYSVLITDINGCRAISAQFEVNVLSVRDPAQLVNSFAVYPNPGNGVFTLDLDLTRPEEVRLEITDLLGRSVYSRKLLSDGTERLRLDLRQRDTGLYFLRLQAGTHTLTRKLFIRK